MKLYISTETKQVMSNHNISIGELMEQFVVPSEPIEDKYVYSVAESAGKLFWLSIDESDEALVIISFDTMAPEMIEQIMLSPVYKTFVGYTGRLQ